MLSRNQSNGKTIIQICKEKIMGVSVDSNVSHPKHYNQGKFEVIEVIEDQKLGFHLGNALKYICRAGKKDPNKVVEDLQKAKWYIERQIEISNPSLEVRRPNDMNPRTNGEKPTSLINSKVVDQMYEIVMRDQLKGIIRQGMGLASVCWEPRPSGVFDSNLCSKELERVVGKVMDLLKSQGQRA
jgi:hypothetical protein